MGPILAGQLSGGIAGDLASSVATLERVGLELISAIAKRVVAAVHLEFYMKVNERYVGYDIGICAPPEFIQTKVWLDFGLAFANLGV